MRAKKPVEKITAGVGSPTSLLLHTIVFAAAFLSAVIGKVSWDTMLLVLTTIVSLEAIYLSILIQMTVNLQAAELAEVSEDVEDIQEDIEEISHDVDEIQKDVDEIQEDVDEIQEDVEEITDEEESDQQKGERQTAAIEQLTTDVRQLLKDLEELKKGQ
jgi:peptidoglycan hydrolase CwlO-like protein